MCGAGSWCSLAKIASRPEDNVIDLTGDDDSELAKAMAASLQDNQEGASTTFGPSNRAPDPNWAMVSSNVNVSSRHFFLRYNPQDEGDVG